MILPTASQPSQTQAGALDSVGPSQDSQAQAVEASVEAESPLFQVTKGNPSAEELAALTAVVLALSAATEAEDDVPSSHRRSWIRRSNLRLAPAPGPGAWKRSSWR
ncbi:acyl-CoA carboxylase subunit epsilon [Psychromicrobium sp. YIM B11713]|uniref:acyl-CoA carboxylase subunit epsilon n=1 Tax=Psychromicrobium sp. YIM B11713 TaxID=3145233 RepID=UPI00374EB16F